MFNFDTGKNEWLNFLQFNQIDDYNNNMGDVDLADQLQGTYRLDHWVQNRKWWWAIVFWALGVMLTNAYVIYKKVNEENGIPKEDLLLQHDFGKAIAIAWINPGYFKLNKASLVVRKNKNTGMKQTNESSSISSISNDFTLTTSTSSCTAVRVNDDALDPLKGKLAC